PHCGGDGRQAHRHVDIEDPPPACVLDDDSAKDRAEGGDEQHRHAEQAHHAPYPGRTRSLDQGGLPDRHEHASAQALDDPEGDERTCRLGETGEDRAEHECREGGEPGSPGAEPGSRPADRGITLAKASMYPVSTHWIVAMEVPRSRPSVGIATLTMVRSRTVIAVPSMTTTASRTMWR